MKKIKINKYEKWIYFTFSGIAAVYFFFFLLAIIFELWTEKIIHREMLKVNKIEVLKWEKGAKPYETTDQDEIDYLFESIANVDPSIGQVIGLKCMCGGDYKFKCYQKDGGVFEITLHHESAIRSDSFPGTDVSLSPSGAFLLAEWLSDKGMNSYSAKKERKRISNKETAADQEI